MNYKLTPEEKKLLIFLANGGEIKMYEKNIKTTYAHFTNLKRKLNIRSVALLTHYAISKDIIKLKNFETAWHQEYPTDLTKSGAY